MVRADPKRLGSRFPWGRLSMIHCRKYVWEAAMHRVPGPGRPQRRARLSAQPAPPMQNTQDGSYTSTQRDWVLVPTCSGGDNSPHGPDSQQQVVGLVLGPTSETVVRTDACWPSQWVWSVIRHRAAHVSQSDHPPAVSHLLVQAGTTILEFS